MDKNKDNNNNQNYNQGPPQGNNQNYNQGPPQGYNQNYNQGPPQGYNQNNQGYNQNYNQGPPQGYNQNNQGPPQGYNQNYNQGPPQGYNQNYNQGPPQGNNQNYNQGPPQGYNQNNNNGPPQGHDQNNNNGPPQGHNQNNNNGPPQGYNQNNQGPPQTGHNNNGPPQGYDQNQNQGPKMPKGPHGGGSSSLRIPDANAMQGHQQGTPYTQQQVGHMIQSSTIVRMDKEFPTGLDSEAKKRRKDIFDRFDVNGNNLLSLAEIDKACRDVLCINKLFKCKPALMRAYMLARDKWPATSKYSDDYVTRNEFRLLLIYLKLYYELFRMYGLIDIDGDRRIDYTEFCAATPIVESWGVVVHDKKATFAKMDKNGKGKVLFDEFCDWAIREEMALENLNEV